MYVIYTNDRPIFLRSEDEEPPALHQNSTQHLKAFYSGKKKTLLNYIDTLEKGSPKVTSVELIARDSVSLWEDFSSHFKWVPAAGGLVTNVQQQRQLFIFRRGSWDLPKGKIDAGEDAPTAALREVREETGLQRISLGEALPTTYHTYRDRKNRRVLKPTYWFKMETEEVVLVPQTEEDIERAEWLAIETVLNSNGPLYGSLRELLSPLAKQK